MNTLRSRATGIALGSLICALALVAAGTSAILHSRAISALDNTLLAAALAAAGPWEGEPLGNEHVRSPVEVSLWDPTQPAATPAQYEQAMLTEQPVYINQGARRVLLLVVDPPNLHESHQVVVTAAQRVTWQDSVLPFLVPFLAVSMLVLLLVGLVLRYAMYLALLPLERAAHQISLVGAIQVGKRLDEDGPPEIKRLLVATNQLLGRLESAFATQVSFTAQAAHELRTPVTILRAEVELALRRERSADEYKAVLGQLSTDFERLHALVEGLLLLARVDAGHIEQGKSLERVSAPIHQALRQEHDALTAAHCTVHVTLDADPELQLHQALFTSAIATLLRNVATHAPGAQLWLQTTRDADTLQISVKDDGPGIQDPERVLQRFQGEPAHKGLGLGLPIAREIAQRHGGDLRISASPAGTTVLVTLPWPSSKPTPS